VPAPPPAEPAPAPVPEAPAPEAPAPEVQPPPAEAPTPVADAPAPAPAPADIVAPAPAPDAPPPADIVAPPAPDAPAATPAPDAPAATSTTQVAEDELILQALNARDSGDLPLAKSRLEEILKLNPANVSALAELESVNKALAAPPPAPLSLLEQTAKANENLYAEVQTAIAYAEDLARNREFNEAIALLDNAIDALPQNVGSINLQTQLATKKQDIIRWRDSKDLTASSPQTAIELTAGELRRQTDAALQLARGAAKKIRLHQLDAAEADILKAITLLPNNIAVEKQRREVNEVRARLIWVRWNDAVNARQLETAERHFAEFTKIVGTESKEYFRLKENFDYIKRQPQYRSLESLNPALVEVAKKVDELLIRGRAFYLHGNFDAAKAVFNDILLYEPDNNEAKQYIVQCNRVLGTSGTLGQAVTRSELLRSVDADWGLGAVYKKTQLKKEKIVDPLYGRIKKTIIPTVTFRDAPLQQALATLADLTGTFAPDQKGFNILAIDPERKNTNPPVSLSLQNASLDIILDYITRSVNYEWTVVNGLIEVAPAMSRSDTETLMFPISEMALKRMKGAPSSAAAVSGGPSSNPFTQGGGGAADIASNSSPEDDAIKGYFQKLDIPFNVPGYNLVYEGGSITVTHQRRYLEKIRDLIARLNDAKMLHIATKFIEVNQGALKEFAANWNFQRTIPTGDGVAVLQTQSKTGLRTLSSASSGSIIGSTGDGVITTATESVSSTGTMTTTLEERPIPMSPPMIPKSSYAGPGLPQFDGTIGSIGKWDLNLTLNWLEAAEGTDLMANPSVVVREKESASIEIVQRLPYPKMYSEGDTQANSNGGGGYNNNNNYSSAGSSSATYRAGAPQEMVWTPGEDDNRIGIVLDIPSTEITDGSLIALELKPVIREFEGFVQYGGSSVAISGNITVSVPSGMYFPVFSERKVNTKVTIYDGATVVLGGLTREEIKTVEDKIPVLGDLPLVGRLFRSSARSTSKRNLMIFVTANILTPGGGYTRQVGDLPPATTFSQRTLTTPGGSVRPSVEEAEETRAPTRTDSQPTATATPAL
jgi:general secretion pathway protein D